MPDRPDPLADLLLALQRAGASAAASIQAALVSETGRTLNAYAEAWKQVGPQILQELAIASQQWLEEFDEALPPNWHDLTHPQIFSTIELMHGTGWSLIGTPPADTIEAILEAPTPQERRAALLAATPAIVEDLTTTIDALRSTELASCAGAAGDALRAFQDGHDRASQALTTATLTTTLHEHLQQSSHRKIRAQFLEAQDGPGELADFCWVAIQGAVAIVLDPYDPLRAPPRSDYRRNASAHRVAAPQYSRVNALSSLMLLTSLLHELHARARRQATP